MASRLYIVAWDSVLEEALYALTPGQSFLSLDAALKSATKGQYIHSIIADTNHVRIGENTLGELVL